MTVVMRACKLIYRPVFIYNIFPGKTKRYNYFLPPSLIISQQMKFTDNPRSLRSIVSSGWFYQSFGFLITIFLTWSTAPAFYCNWDVPNFFYPAIECHPYPEFFVVYLVLVPHIHGSKLDFQKRKTSSETRVSGPLGEGHLTFFLFYSTICKWTGTSRQEIVFV